MKKNKNIIFTTLLCLLPIIYGVVLYDKLPNEIPSHFDFGGNIDDYMSKPLFVFGMPLFFAAMNLLVNFVIKSDPKNHNQNSIMINLPKYIMFIIANLSMGLVYYKVIFDNNFNFSRIIIILVGIMFIILGNYLPKCRQNYTIGIKIPWTLNSEANWNKTHRFAGYIFVLTGILIIVLNFILPVDIYTISLVIFIIIMCLIPMIYSYILYRNGI